MNKTLMVMALIMAIPSAAQAYVGIGTGRAKTDTNHTSYKIFAGSQPSQSFGLEVAYNDFGKYRAAKTDSWSLAAIGTMPMANNWDLFGKLGATRNHIKFGNSSRRTGLLAGVGLGFKPTQNIGLRVEYEDFGKLPTDMTGVSTKVTNWSVNAKFSY